MSLKARLAALENWLQARQPPKPRFQGIVIELCNDAGQVEEIEVYGRDFFAFKKREDNL